MEEGNSFVEDTEESDSEDLREYELEFESSESEEIRAEDEQCPICMEWLETVWLRECVLCKEKCCFLCRNWYGWCIDCEFKENDDSFVQSSD
jgi:hypothetical protein